MAQLESQVKDEIVMQVLTHFATWKQDWTLLRQLTATKVCSLSQTSVVLNYLFFKECLIFKVVASPQACCEVGSIDSIALIGLTNGILTNQGTPMGLD